MAYRVPFIDSRAQYQRLQREIDDAIHDCLSNGDLIYRRHLRAFEAELAEFVGVDHAVGVNSGYHALHLSMLAAGVGPGDEVVTVAHTFVASISAIVHCGADPVLLDVGDDFNLDTAALEEAITDRTKAIMVVHLNGRMCDMTAVQSIADAHDLLLFEDAAQALGAQFAGKKAGSWGVASCFSFYPFKILGALGDGGAVTTNDAELARAVSRLRYNGEDRDTGEYHGHGYTALLDNIQAAVLSVKMPHLPAWIEHRRSVAARYRSGLEGVGDLSLPHFPEDEQTDVFQNYVVRSGRRDELRAHLEQDGVETLVHWEKPVWEHPALGLEDVFLPATARISREVVSLPLSAETTTDHVDETVRSIRAFFS